MFVTGETLMSENSVTLDRSSAQLVRGLRASTEQLIDSVIEDVLSGVAIRDACAKIGYSPKWLLEKISSEREWSQRYARAMELRADLWADEIIHIADDENIDTNRARNMIQARQWNAAKAAPKKFGERIDLNVTQTLDISGTMLEAKRRLLRPVSDQQDVIDAQVVDAQGLIASEPRDKESASAEPDIFAPLPKPPGEDEVDIFS